MSVSFFESMIIAVSTAASMQINQCQSINANQSMQINLTFMHEKVRISGLEHSRETRIIIHGGSIREDTHLSFHRIILFRHSIRSCCVYSSSWIVSMYCTVQYCLCISLLLLCLSIENQMKRCVVRERRRLASLLLACIFWLI